ncbi:MAG TPA: nitrilase-related carbon-nitrogen hydrolase [Candidatus Hydrogenedentes bacterium]|nr:nitrilase-related carbon-nitrogen hydrolase [Candidatus Hydrogenedentota bacterium]HOL76167.1 nitrilase-related carbon-nitrogen hydrolase [Candidatus Hydrogenedentota bacterium]HPO84782.1 nitrilase-related carbon-nitrogen hydrolase [Candidatus Hydrogenedentota bacterium]
MTKPSSGTLKVAAVRVVWVQNSEEPDEVVERGFRLAAEAAAQGAKLIVFPENFLHSRNPADQMIPDGMLVKRTETFAKEHSVYVVAGIIESWKFDWRQTYDTFLSAIVVGPEGYLSKHRKVDVNMVPYDRTWKPGMPKTDMDVWPGDDFAMHKAGPIERMGILICRDSNSSWAWTRVLTQNPQIIVSPNLRDSVVKYGADFGAMAALSGVPMVVACGHPESESFIVNRRGEVVAFLNDREGAIVADVELAPRDPMLVSFDVVHNSFVVPPEY